jgi:hypothetical protein
MCMACVEAGAWVVAAGATVLPLVIPAIRKKCEKFISCGGEVRSNTTVCKTVIAGSNPARSSTDPALE